jgi:hypothetical protein
MGEAPSSTGTVSGTARKDVFLWAFSLEPSNFRTTVDQRWKE